MYRSDKIWDSLPSWLTGNTQNSDIVLGSRIRLARNLKNFPFPNNATDEKLDEIVEKTQNIIENRKLIPGLEFLPLHQLSKKKRQMLSEKRMISPKFSKKSDHGAVIIDSQLSFSVMVNEEDHFHFQVIDTGIGIEYLWEKIHGAEKLFNSVLNFSFSEEFGYLTSCPTNTGTGLRISILLNLPVLEFEGSLESILDNLCSLEITVRSFYGEVSEIVGSIYQISNKLTLGLTEFSLLDDFLKIASNIVDKEQKARHKLFDNRSIEIEDKIFRSLGIIERARMLSSREFIEHYSTLMLGIDVGLITGVEIQDLRELLLWVQPAHLQWQYGKELNSFERDVTRAEMIRTKLGI